MIQLTANIYKEWSKLFFDITKVIFGSGFLAYVLKNQFELSQLVLILFALFIALFFVLGTLCLLASERKAQQENN